MKDRTIDILLVEDNPGDVSLTLEILRASAKPCRVEVVGDGEEALSFLRREGIHERAPRPQLVLLDLKLPGKQGHEVLAEMKADDLLVGIPVVIFSGSRDHADILKAYRLRANCYVPKPAGLEALREALRGLEGFWLETASLPVK